MDRAAYMKEYAANPANAARIRAAKEAWYARVKGTEAHKARGREVMRNLYAKNPEKFRARRRARVKANPHLNRESVRRYQAMVRQQTPLWADRRAILSIYAEAVRLTGATGVAHEVDHEIPLNSPLVCGLHVPSNLRVITKSENSRKRNKFEVA